MTSHRYTTCCPERVMPWILHSKNMRLRPESDQPTICAGSAQTCTELKSRSEAAEIAATWKCTWLRHCRSKSWLARHVDMAQSIQHPNKTGHQIQNWSIQSLSRSVLSKCAKLLDSIQNWAIEKHQIHVEIEWLKKRKQIWYFFGPSHRKPWPNAHHHGHDISEMRALQTSSYYRNPSTTTIAAATTAAAQQQQTSNQRNPLQASVRQKQTAHSTCKSVVSS